MDLNQTHSHSDQELEGFSESDALENRSSAKRDFQEPFEVLEPRKQTLPFVLNSPHSGRVYPPRFLASSNLDPLTLRRSEDSFVDEIFSGAVELGAPLLRAHFPRAYLDVNREPYELDPAMFTDPLPPHVNTRSVRVAGGLGTIARIVAEDTHSRHLHALSRNPQGLAGDNPPEVWPSRADRLPLHALNRRPLRRRN